MVPLGQRPLPAAAGPWWEDWQQWERLGSPASFEDPRVTPAECLGAGG